MPKLNRVSAAPIALSQTVQPGTKWTTAESASYLATGLPVTLEQLPLHLELCPPGLVGPYDLALKLAAKARLKEQEEAMSRSIQGRPGWLRRGRSAVDIFCGMGGFIWDFVNSALDEYGESIVRKFAEHVEALPPQIEERLSPGLRLLAAFCGARRITPTATPLHPLGDGIRSFRSEAVASLVWHSDTTMHLNGDVSQRGAGLIYCDLSFDARQLMSVAGPGSALTTDPSSITQDILPSPDRADGLRGPHFLRDPMKAEIRARLSNGTAPAEPSDFLKELDEWAGREYPFATDTYPHRTSILRWIDEVLRERSA